MKTGADWSDMVATAASQVPVTGAWKVGDPPGDRCFVTIALDRPMFLEGGGMLASIAIAYESWGQLDATGSNAILVCHALTMDSHAAGGASAPQAVGWWDGLIGPGRAIDTERYYVVCANVLGGCQGSTGPSSLDPVTGRPYGSTFPVVTIRDMVRTQKVLADRLGVGRWLSVIGGSMGGMQVLEWGVTFPERIRSLIPIATTAQASAQQIALGAVGRNAIRLDPNWQGGDYYGAAPGHGPHQGVVVARMLAQITYRSDDVLTDRFGREMADQQDGFSMWQRFEVERYLEYQGDKLVRRFDANSYLSISKAMDLHDVGRGRGGFETAMSRVSVPVLCIGIDSDSLYPTYQQRRVVEALTAQDKPAEYVEVTSPHGHDAFLINLDRVGAPMAAFLERVEKSGGQ